MKFNPEDNSLYSQPNPFEVGDLVVLNEDATDYEYILSSFLRDEPVPYEVIAIDNESVELRHNTFYHTRFKLYTPPYTENDILPQELPEWMTK